VHAPYKVYITLVFRAREKRLEERRDSISFSYWYERSFLFLGKSLLFSYNSNTYISYERIHDFSLVSCDFALVCFLACCSMLQCVTLCCSELQCVEQSRIALIRETNIVSPLSYDTELST